MKPKLLFAAKKLALFTLIFALIVANVTPAAAAFRPMATNAISGLVTDGSGGGVEGVTVLASRNGLNIKLFLPLIQYLNGSAAPSAASTSGSVMASSYRTITDTNGAYTFASLPEGSYTLTVSKAGIDFVPADRQVTVPAADSQDFQVKILTPDIPLTTEVISPDTNQHLQSISTDGSVFTYSQTTPDLQALAAGDIMVSDGTTGAPDGFLRKVTGVTNEGGSTVVTTEPALLEEAVQDGSAYFHQPLSPGQITQTSKLAGVSLAPSSLTPNALTFTYTVVDAVLDDADGNQNTKDDQVKANGTISFELDNEFYINIHNFQLTKLTYVNRNSLRDNLTISSMMSRSLSKEKVIASHNFQPFTITIGAVPVVVVPCLELVVGVDGSVKVGISTSISHDLTMRAGVEYVNPGGWKPISELTDTYTFTPPHATLEASVKGSFGVRVNLFLYGVAGPYVRISPYMKFEVKPLETPWWALYGGLDVPAGFKANETLKKILNLNDYEVGAIGVEKVLLQAQSPNHPPAQPGSPSPVDNAAAVNLTPALSWTGSDPDNDPLTYDVYMEAGNSSPSILVSSKQTNTTFQNPAALLSGVTYYWQIKASDDHGAITAGPVWKFTTAAAANQPPNVPLNPSPANNAASVNPGALLFWSGGDPDGDAVTYDVYLQAGNPTPGILASNGQTGTSFKPSQLTASTTYYWQVVARDAHGATTTGPVWNFTTSAGINPGLIISKLSAGVDHTCALNDSGVVKCWGSDQYGQLGDLSTLTQMTPVNVSGLGSGVTTVSSGSQFTCAITAAGRLNCWGNNSFGQIGDGTTLIRYTPVEVVGVGLNVQAVSTGGNFACALTAAGGVKCWGQGQYGRLGNGSSSNQLTAVDVSGLTSGVKAVATGSLHACALLSGGGVKCWGYNASGQLGNGNGLDQYTPVDVSGLASGVVSLAAGGSHTCALLSNGTAKCWGLNANGQLGNDSLTNSSTPVEVIGLTDQVLQLEGGSDYTCAMLANGGVQCWGYNNAYQLGDGTTNRRTIPTAVVGLGGSATQLSVGASHACVRLSSGALQCWGLNNSGQLGDGTTTTRSTPTNVSGFTGTGQASGPTSPVQAIAWMTTSPEDRLRKLAGPFGLLIASL